MEMVEVKSSNIKKVGFDQDKLYVEYNSGMYVYKQVPQALYEGLIKAESKGSYMNAYIKGHYEFDKVSNEK